VRRKERRLGRAWPTAWWIVTTLAALPVSAALRSPQVPVSGTALATFFTSQGQTINPTTDQVELQRMSWPTNGTIQVNPFPGSGTTLGLYNAAFAVPPIYLILPGAAANGWFTLASFR